MSQHEYVKQFNSKILDGAIHQDPDLTTPYLSDYAVSLPQNPEQSISP
jgi:hypothetical protein